MRKYRHDVPSAFSTFLQIFSGALVGLMIAGAYLALKPVKITDAPPPDKAAAKDGSAGEHNVVTYVRGNPGNPYGQQWRVREKALLDKAQTGVTVSEEDVNRWIAANYGGQDMKFEIKSYDFTIVPALPNCRIDGNRVQLGLEVDWTLMKNKHTVAFQALGSFEKNGDQQVFVPEKVYLGSCPLPGPLGAMLYSKLAGFYPVPENVTAAWKSVANLSVEESRIKLAFN